MNRPYVYRLTDTHTGKWYIGCSYSKRSHPDKLGVLYFTSSKLVKALYKNDVSRFIKEILIIGPSKYIHEREVDLLTILDAKK